VRFKFIEGILDTKQEVLEEINMILDHRPQNSQRKPFDMDNSDAESDMSFDPN